MNTIIPSPAYISLQWEIHPITWVIIWVSILLLFGIYLSQKKRRGISQNTSYQTPKRDYKKDILEVTGESREQLSKISLLLREYLEENNILQFATKKTPHEISYLSKKQELDDIMLEIEAYIYRDTEITPWTVTSIKERSIGIINQ